MRSRGDSRSRLREGRQCEGRVCSCRRHRGGVVEAGNSLHEPASLSMSLGAGISPLLGGRFADFFSVRAFSVTVEWIDPTRSLQLLAFNLTGYDFLFAVAFLMGILTLSTLKAVREDGETSREVALEELLSSTGGMVRVLNSVPGLAFAVQIPYSYLKSIPGVDVVVGVSEQRQ